MKILAVFDIPDELRNELLQYLDAFEAAHPGCRLEMSVQSTPPVCLTAFLREPASPVLEHRGPDKPPPSRRERVKRQFAPIRTSGRGRSAGK